MLRGLKSLLLGGSELIMAVALVLGLFLVVTIVLALVLPAGTGLVGLYEDVVGPGEGRSVLELGEGQEGTFVASVSHVRRDVKERAASAITWSSAAVGMALGDQHAIQTMGGSGAEISFEAGNLLRLDENSLVVVKKTSRRRGRRVASLVVLGGNVRGIVDPKATEPLALDIVTAEASTRILADGDDPAEFSVTVNPDETSTLSVFSGSAEVTAGGETAIVGPNQAVTVAPDQAPSPPRRIPDAPELVAPRPGSVQVQGPIAPRVRFAWDRARGAEQYRLVIARDAGFDSVVYDERIAGTTFDHGGLDAGEYHWRVVGLSEEAAGRPSTARTLRIARDFDPPALSVDLPQETVSVPVLTVAGMTEPGAELLIDGRPVPLSETGAFEFVMSLRRGPNMVVIEAVDAAGNTAYHSQYVNAKY